MKTPILKVEELGKVTVAEIQERKLYQNVVEPFQKSILDLVDRDKRQLIIDMSKVDVINSSGLGVLILLCDRLNREGGKMAITGLCPLIDELFSRMRLYLLFKITKTREEAVAWMAEGK